MLERGSGAGSSRPIVLALVLLGLSVRVAHLVHVAPTPILEYHRAFRESDMFMFDQWARRIVAGDVLGREVYQPLNQWQLATAPLEKWREWYGTHGPIFYKAPLYPYLIACLYWAFGDALPALIVLQIVASCASIALLYSLTDRLLGSQAALVAALVLGCYGPAVHYDVLMLRGPWITLVSLLATWQLAGLRSSPTPLRAFRLGVTVGASLLVNEGFLTAPPLVLALLAFWGGSPRRIAILAGAFGVGLMSAVAPLVVRNVAVGVAPLQLAVTGSTVYAVFNSAGSNPFFLEWRQASFVPVLFESGGTFPGTVWACLRSFSGPGAILAFYIQKAGGLAIAFEIPDNASFYYAAVKDPLLGLLPGYGFVFPLSLLGLGIAARRRAVTLLPLLPFSLSLLISILITLPLSRYRATFAVYLLPFAGLAVVSAARWWRVRAFRPLAVATTALLLVAWASRSWQARVVFAGAPAGIHLYRPSEFLLGAEIQAKRGRYGAAAREVLDLLRLNPSASFRPSALLLLATLQAQNGDVTAARDTLEALIPPRERIQRY